MRGLFRKRRTIGQQGAVSIYLMAATASMMLLTALLIDLARVAAFRQHAELAVKAGVRSVLSSYDPLLFERYGLFVRGGDPAEELFGRTLSGHAEEGSEGELRLLDIEWDRSEVTESRPLADQALFRQQVAEEMKYRAPVDLTLELASRFRGVSAAVREAGAAADALERMKQAYDRREQALDDAMRLQQRAGSRMAQAADGLVPRPPAAWSGGLPAGPVENVADAVLRYEDYVNRKMREREDGATPDDDAAAYEKGVSDLADKLGSAAGAASSAEADLREAAEAVGQAESANAEMQAIADQAQAEETTAPEAEASDTPADQDALRNYRELRSRLTGLVLDGAFFAGFREELDAQRSETGKLAEAERRFAELAAAVPGSFGLGGALRDRADALQSAYGDFCERYGNGGTVPRSREQTVAQHRTGDAERNAFEREAGQSWNEASGLLGALRGLQPSAEDKEAFRKVEQLASDNLEWNRQEREQAASDLGSSPSAGRDKALRSTEGWLDGLWQTVAGAGDRLFFSEYVYGRFARFEPADVRRVMGGESVPLSPDRLETEYILYGLASPAADIAAAYGEVFAFRLAVRTAEGLAESGKYGNPLVALAAALAYGVRSALADMYALLDKGSVELSKWVRTETRYSDYLRLFLLLQGESAGAAARTIAVIERNTGIDFREAFTYASGESAASIRLWFLPGVMRVLGKTGSLAGTVKGGRYEAVFAADDSY